MGEKGSSVRGTGSSRLETEGAFLLVVAMEDFRGGGLGSAAKAGSKRSSTDEALVEHEERDEYEAMVESENLEESEAIIARGEGDGASQSSGC